MSGLLIVALSFQFRAPRYVAGVYWITVVLVSIVGTLITDNLSDNCNVPLEDTTTMRPLPIVFSHAGERPHGRMPATGQKLPARLRPVPPSPRLTAGNRRAVPHPPRQRPGLQVRRRDRACRGGSAR